MTRIKTPRTRGRRPSARIAGEAAAQRAALGLGGAVKAARARRQLTQAALAGRVGLSRQAESLIERGGGAHAPVSDWFALGEALGLRLQVAYARDTTEDLADAGHLRMQELILRLGRAAGYDRGFEIPTHPGSPVRSTDVRLLDRARRRMILVECWNSFGDLGASARSSSRKLAEATALAVSLGSDEGPFQVGTCWVVRATTRNRELVGRYPHIFAAHLPGSSRRWVAALTSGSAFPEEPGFVWCDATCTRLFARRR